MSIFGIVVALLCLGLLIFWHELGHFLAARACRVHVECFSIGFGKTLASWRDKHGTLFRLAVLPLGGYVRMYGEPAEGQPGFAGEQAPPRDARAFSQASLWQRLIIVLAGPAFNLLLAWLLLSLINLQGITRLKPYINTPAHASQAADAGLERGDLLLSLDGQPLASWGEFQLGLFERLGNTGEIRLQAGRDGNTTTHSLEITDWLASTHQPEPALALGLSPWLPRLEPRVEQVLSGNAAERAGLVPGDLILAVDDQQISYWSELVAIVQASPEQSLDLLVERQSKQLHIQLRPSQRLDTNGLASGYAGVAVVQQPYPADKLVVYHPGLVQSFARGLDDSGRMIRLIWLSLVKLVGGDIAFSNLSGPVGIVAQVGDSAKQGLRSLLGLAAYLSVSLGLLNLLPIPLLDGGQALLLLGEGLAGRPLGEWWRMQLMRFSIALLAMLMLATTFNDLLRLW